MSDKREGTIIINEKDIVFNLTTNVVKRQILEYGKIQMKIAKRAVTIVY